MLNLNLKAKMPKLSLNISLRKFFTTVLLLLMLFNSFSPLISLVSASPSNSDRTKPTTTFKEFERVDLRTANSKTFQTGTNKFRLETYTSKIHYGSKGNFKEIDNNFSLISDPKYKYKNIANDYQFFAGNDLNAGVKFIDYRGVCEFKLAQITGVNLNNSLAVIKDNTVTYPNIYPGADLVFTAEPSTLTTNVVVKDKKNLKPQLNFELSNCAGSVFSPPTVSDGLKSAKIAQKITNINGKKSLNLTPDYSKLGNIKGEVHIDPTIQTNIGPAVNVFTSDNCGFGNARRFIAFGNFYDTTINADCGRTESYLKFDLSSLSGAIITSANLSVQRYATSNGGFTALTARLTQDINSSTGQSTQDWKGKAEQYGSQGIDWNQLDFRNFQFDLTGLVQAWTLGTYPNYGVAIFANAPGFQVGAAVCSTRNDPLCSSNHNPVLIVNYTSNQPPYTPNLVSPNNNQTFSGNCNQSVSPQTGICNTSLPVNLQISGVGDGDPSPGNLKLSELHFSGANNFVANLGGSSGTLNYSGNFADGQTNWFARSIDGLNASSDSVNFNFKSDTTPPVIPNNPILPAYTKGVVTSTNPQITISAPATTDNLSAQANISYQLQYSTVADFSDVTKIYTKSWQLGNPLFQIGPYGADGIQGTADDLVDQGTYYFRINARDELNNISAWSNITSTTVLSTLPVVNSFTASLTRISPNNPTSTGFKSTQLSLSYTEKYPQTANLEIRDASNNLVNTLTQDITANFGVTTPVNLSFNWDGKDASNTYLADGPYTITAKVYGKAGNINTTQPTQIVIVDNSGANISLSAPKYDYWTNQTSFTITGQVKSPAIPGKQDQDFSKLEIKPISGSWSTITPDPLGIFSTNQILQPGLNQFLLRSTDTVNNQVSQIYDPATSSYRPLWQINQDKTAPLITNISPNSLINNKRPTISFKLTDPDPVGDRSQTSDLPTGVLPVGLKLSLSYDVFDTSKPSPYPTITKTLVLADNGLNPSPSLVSNLTCVAALGAVISNKNNHPSVSSENCSLSFLSDLSPDDTYTINVSASDNAGNLTTDSSTNFKLDSFNYLSLTNPIQAGVYSNSSVTFKGTASKNTTLTIANTNLSQTRSFTLNESLNSTGKDSFLTSNFIVTCGKYVTVTNGGNLVPQEEVCDWQVNVLQQYALINTNTLNTNIVSSIDAAGNLVSVTRNLISNIYSFNLTVQSDLTYFSPNGDGNQDSVNFAASATNPQDPSNPPNIATWELRLRDNVSNIVKLFTGSGYLPPSIFFDGHINLNNQAIWLPDGAYTYELYVKTLDNAQLTTNPKPLIAKTVLTNQVVITTPNDNFVTTEGIINVQGQAPKAQSLTGQPTSLRGNVLVDICDQTVGVNVSCGITQEVQADSNGFFESLIILPSIPNQSQVQHKLSAKAHDIYGNQTPISNIVNVILDTIDPFTSATITPTLTGVSSSYDYQRFLNGQIPISQLKTLTLSAGITQNTEGVEYDFSNFSNLSQRPLNPSYTYIAGVNNTAETNPLLNPASDSSIKNNTGLDLNNPAFPSNSCTNAAGCSWSYVFPVSPGFSGIYEVKFKAKKGTNIQELTRGFRADASISYAPLIMVVEKWDTNLNDWIQINPINQAYYSNTTKIRLRGAAEPGTTLKLNSFNTQVASVIVPTSGIFEFVYDFSTTLNGTNPIIHCSNYQPNCVEGNLNFNLVEQLFDSKNNLLKSTPGSNSASLNYDTLPPQALSITRTSALNTIPGWAKTGDSISYSLVANKGLLFSDIAKEDGYTQLLLNTSGNNWVGAINADRSSEGYYNPQIRLIDYAGNKMVYQAQNYQSYGLGDFRIYIDNTPPDQTSIDTSSWGGVGGVKGSILPSLGRTNPQFVTNQTSVVIKGQAEARERVELDVNNKFLSFIDVSGNNCHSLAPDKITADNLTTKYGSICDWSYTYQFPGNGKADDGAGAPLESYIFQVRTLDKAANYASFSPQQIVYHDSNNPITPQITKAQSSSYSPIPAWQTNGNGGAAITKDSSVTLTSLAERFSDLEYTQYFKGNQIQYLFLKNSASRLLDQSFNLGKQARDDSDPNCIALVGNRRVGTCSDGNYSFSLKSTDAAGNAAPTLSNVNIERDTVAPAQANLSISADDNAQRISLNITGESNSTAIINDNQQYNLGNDGSVFVNVVDSYSWQYSTTYTFKVFLQDRAGNQGVVAIATYTTPPPPVRVNGVCTGNVTAGKLPYPFAGSYGVTSPFGNRTLNGVSNFHDGMDFGLPTGTEVLAVANGTVVYRSDDVSQGLGVIIHHPELGISTIYWHFEKSNVRYGDYVTQGEVIGLSDNTGNSTGPHLHFGVRTGGPGTEVDPNNWLVNCDSTSHNSNSNEESGVKPLSGNRSDAYNGKTAADLAGYNNMEIDIFSPLILNNLRRNYVTYSNIPAPVITYIQNDDKQEHAKVYGIGINAQANVKIVLSYEYMESTTCTFIVTYDCSIMRTSHKTYMDKLKNVGLSLNQPVPWYQFKSSDKEIGFNWSNPTDGRWEMDLNLGGNNDANPKVGDNIYAQTKIWSDTNLDMETGRLNIDYTSNNRPVLSPQSNQVTIPGITLDELKTKLKNDYNIDLKEQDEQWQVSDLLGIVKGMSLLPEKFYKGSNMVLIMQKSLPKLDQLPGRSCNKYSDGSFTGGYVGGNLASNEVVMCSQERTENRIDHNFASTVIHEFTHIYQKNISTSDIKYGHNVLTDKTNKLYTYYNILFSPDKKDWILRTDRVDMSKISDPCDADDNDPYFVSWYQCEVSARFKQLAEKPTSAEPEEEMAESVKEYITNPDKLKLKDSDTKPDLGRYQYIKNNFINK